MRQSAHSLLWLQPSSVYSPQSGQTDFKTKTRSCCSSVQNPLWAPYLLFCKTQSHTWPTKPGAVCTPLLSSALLLLSPVRTPLQVPNALLSQSICPCLHSAWEAPLPDSLHGALPRFLQVSVRLSLYQRGLPQPPISHTHTQLRMPACLDACTHNAVPHADTRHHACPPRHLQGLRHTHTRSFKRDLVIQTPACMHVHTHTHTPSISMWAADLA